MTKLPRVDMTKADGASLRIAHNVQDARTIRLQHINNNHLDATAKGPQSTMSQHCTHGPSELRSELGRTRPDPPWSIS